MLVELFRVKIEKAFETNGQPCQDPICGRPWNRGLYTTMESWMIDD